MLFIVAALPLPLLRLARREAERALEGPATHETERLVDGDVSRED